MKCMVLALGLLLLASLPVEADYQAGKDAHERGDYAKALREMRPLRDKTMRRNVVLMAQAQERARRLEGIVRPLRDQGATLRDIAVALNKAGQQTPRGGSWHPTSVSRLLARI